MWLSIYSPILLNIRPLEEIHLISCDTPAGYSMVFTHRAWPFAEFGDMIFNDQRSDLDSWSEVVAWNSRGWVPRFSACCRVCKVPHGLESASKRFSVKVNSKKVLSLNVVLYFCCPAFTLSRSVHILPSWAQKLWNQVSQSRLRFVPILFLWLHNFLYRPRCTNQQFEIVQKRPIRYCINHD